MTQVLILTAFMVLLIFNLDLADNNRPQAPDRAWGCQESSLKYWKRKRKGLCWEAREWLLTDIKKVQKT